VQQRAPPSASRRATRRRRRGTAAGQHGPQRSVVREQPPSAVSSRLAHPVLVSASRTGLRVAARPRWRHQASAGSMLITRPRAGARSFTCSRAGRPRRRGRRPPRSDPGLLVLALGGRGLPDAIGGGRASARMRSLSACRTPRARDAATSSSSRRLRFHSRRLSASASTCAAPSRFWRSCHGGWRDGARAWCANRSARPAEERSRPARTRSPPCSLDSAERALRADGGCDPAAPQRPAQHARCDRRATALSGAR
jgi:hypothetical protein